MFEVGCVEGSAEHIVDSLIELAKRACTGREKLLLIHNR